MSQAYALALTVGFESLVAVIALRVWGLCRPRPLFALLALVIAASAITHPLAWQANRVWLRHLPFENRAAIIELTVVAVEAALVWLGSQRIEGGRVSPGRALLLSLLCNATSFGVGLAIAYA